MSRLHKAVIYKGNQCLCPVCNSGLQKFMPHGRVIRENARCPVCGSLERHRLVWLYLAKETDLFSNTRKRLLHVAPERCFVEKISKYNSIEYLTADLERSAMVKMDITDIQYPDESFDIIYCSHVLEHIQDDLKAMRELCRVLKPNGWAILQVPIGTKLETTFEDLSIEDPDKREKLFGHPGHFRIYEQYNYKERLEKSGFSVEIIPYANNYNNNRRTYYGINISDGSIYRCIKRQ